MNEQTKVAIEAIHAFDLSRGQEPDARLQHLAHLKLEPVEAITDDADSWMHRFSHEVTDALARAGVTSLDEARSLEHLKLIEVMDRAIDEIGVIDPAGDGESGQGLTEYGLLLGLVSVASVIALGLLTGAITSILGDITTILNNATP